MSFLMLFFLLSLLCQQVINYFDLLLKEVRQFIYIPCYPQANYKLITPDQAMDSKKKSLTVRIDKYAYSQHHFFFTAHSIDYFIFFGKGNGYTIKITEGISKKFGQFQMQDIVPIHFVSTGRGDISILYEDGILDQYVEKLSPTKSFYKIEFERQISPKKLIKIEDNNYIIVTKSGTLVFLKDGAITKQVQYPTQMLMQQLEFDCQQRELFQPRLIVPNRNNLFPFIFSARQVLEFSIDGYLQNKIKKYQYYEDEKLPQQQYKLCFCPGQNKIYLAYTNQIIILKIKFLQTKDIDYTSVFYFRCKNRWNEVPLFISASNITPSFVVVNNSRYCDIYPDSMDKSNNVVIRQKLKDNRVVSAGYGLSNCSSVFVSFDKSGTRLLLV